MKPNLDQIKVTLTDFVVWWRRLERVAGVRSVEAHHRRLQRPVSAAGADDEPGHEAAPLAAPHRNDGPRLPHRRARLLPAQHRRGAAATAQGGGRGHLHLGPQGEGHRGQTASGPRRVHARSTSSSSSSLSQFHQIQKKRELDDFLKRTITRAFNNGILSELLSTATGGLTGAATVIGCTGDQRLDDQSADVHDLQGPGRAVAEGRRRRRPHHAARGQSHGAELTPHQPLQRPFPEGQWTCPRITLRISKRK